MNYFRLLPSEMGQRSGGEYLLASVEKKLSERSEMISRCFSWIISAFYHLRGVRGVVERICWSRWRKNSSNDQRWFLCVFHGLFPPFVIWEGSEEWWRVFVGVVEAKNSPDNQSPEVSKFIKKWVISLGNTITKMVEIYGIHIASISDEYFNVFFGKWKSLKNGEAICQ